MMYTMPKNLLSICVNFTLATQQIFLKNFKTRKTDDFSDTRNGLCVTIEAVRKLTAKKEEDFSAF